MTHERLYSVGTRIRQIRESKGMTPTELANKMGVAKQTVYKWERDITKHFPLDTLRDISEALNVNPSYLAGWSSSIERTPDIISKGEQQEEFVSNIL